MFLCRHRAQHGDHELDLQRQRATHATWLMGSWENATNLYTNITLGNLTEADFAYPKF